MPLVRNQGRGAYGGTPSIPVPPSPNFGPPPMVGQAHASVQSVPYGRGAPGIQAPPPRTSGPAFGQQQMAQQNFYAQNPTYPGGESYVPMAQTPGTGGYSPWTTPSNAAQPGIPPGYNPIAGGLYQYQAGAYNSYFNPATGQFSTNSGGPNTELGGYDWRPLVDAQMRAERGY